MNSSDQRVLDLESELGVVAADQSDLGTKAIGDVSNGRRLPTSLRSTGPNVAAVTAALAVASSSSSSFAFSSVPAVSSAAPVTAAPGVAAGGSVLPQNVAAATRWDISLRFGRTLAQGPQVSTLLQFGPSTFHVGVLEVWDFGKVDDGPGDDRSSSESMQQ